MLLCYVATVTVLCPLISALSGPRTFSFGGSLNNHSPSQDNPPRSSVYYFSKNGENSLIDLERGYLTYFLYKEASKNIFFVTYYYLSHLYLVVATRCIFFLMACLLKCIKWYRRNRTRGRVATSLQRLQVLRLRMELHQLRQNLRRVSQLR